MAGVTDILVKFTGGTTRDNGNEALEGIAVPANYSSLGRTLVGVARGAEINRPELYRSAFDEIMNITNSSTLGLLCIRGSSRGGIWAIKLAELLTERGIPISFVGLQDAAFSTVDAINEPSSRFQFAIDNAPLFETKQIKADIKVSHFQMVGNKAEFSLSRGKLIWASDLDGEIHGEVRGFQSDRVNVTGYEKDDAGLAHNFCCGRAEVRDRQTIAGLLQKACN